MYWTHRKERLMIPLTIKLVVVVVNIHPPAIVVREYG